MFLPPQASSVMDHAIKEAIEAVMEELKIEKIELQINPRDLDEYRSHCPPPRMCGNGPNLSWNLGTNWSTSSKKSSQSLDSDMPPSDAERRLSHFKEVSRQVSSLVLSRASPALDVDGSLNMYDPTDLEYDEETGLYGPREREQTAVDCRLCGNELSFKELSMFTGSDAALTCQACVEMQDKIADAALEDIEEIDKLLSEV